MRTDARTDTHAYDIQRGNMRRTCVMACGRAAASHPTPPGTTRTTSPDPHPHTRTNPPNQSPFRVCPDSQATRGAVTGKLKLGLSVCHLPRPQSLQEFYWGKPGDRSLARLRSSGGPIDPNIDNINTDVGIGIDRY